MQLEEAEPLEPHCWLEASNERLNPISSIESDKRGLNTSMVRSLDFTILKDNYEYS
jgi:hypothetical protein